MKLYLDINDVVYETRYALAILLVVEWNTPMKIHTDDIYRDLYVDLWKQFKRITL